MTDQQWGEAWEIYHTAWELPENERGSFLASVSTDPEIIEQVMLLLREPALQSWPASKAGTRIGHYEIVGILGRGGMGQVYSARDTELGRMVALKFLAPEMVATRPAVERLVREAKAASALNHPQIVTVYEVLRSGDDVAIAMELVEGEALSTFRGTLKPIALVIHWGRQVAQALAAAHRRGIIHRDIKPENLMLRPDGYVKVLDFGLARQIALGGQSLSLNLSGMVAGTLNYMAPEQTRAERTTSASDVFSLGIVLYELAAGKHPFRADSPVDTAHAIAHSEPRLPSALNANVPPELDSLLLAMLAKDSGKRPSAEEVEGRLAGIGKAGLEKQSRGLRWRRPRLSVALATCALIAIVAVLWAFWRPASHKASLSEIVPLTSFAGYAASPTFSPDGREVAFAWNGDKEDNYDIYVKLIGEGTPVRLTTNPAHDLNPAWSPDGRTIAFLRLSPESRDIVMIPALGGPERILCQLSAQTPDWTAKQSPVRVPETPSWSPDGKFLAISDRPVLGGPEAILSIRAEDGSKHQITFPPQASFGDKYAAFSPDGRTLAFVRVTSVVVADIYTLPLSGAEARRLTSANRDISGLAWTADNRSIVFASNRGGAYGLWRMPAGGGSPEQIPGAVGNIAYPAVSRLGSRLAYTTLHDQTNIWHSEAGSVATKWISSSRQDDSPQYSPDGRKIVFVSNRSGFWEIWSCARDGSNPSQLTRFHGGTTGTPRWSPDGRQIIFDARQDEHSQVFVMTSSGGAPQRLTSGRFANMMPSWSRDGRSIYFNSTRTGKSQIWKMAADGGQLSQLTRGGGQEAYESPDGKSIYYSRFGKAGIWTLALQDGIEQAVPELATLVHRRYWTVTGRGIYFLSPEPSVRSVMLLNLETRAITHVADIGSNLTHGSPGLSISNDGRQILFVQVERDGSDIMLVENFH